MGATCGICGSTLTTGGCPQCNNQTLVYQAATEIYPPFECYAQQWVGWNALPHNVRKAILALTEVQP